MRYCVIGNSHCNALKHASDDPTSPLAGRVSYITAPGAELRLDISHSKIVPLTTRLYMSLASDLVGCEVRVNDYDAFAIVGMAMVSHQPLRLYKQGYRLFEHRQPGMNLLSRGAFKKALAGLLGQSEAFEIAKSLRSQTDKPIYLVAQPLPVEKIKIWSAQNEQQRKLIDQWHPAFDLALANDLDCVFVETMKDVANELDVDFLAQPRFTRGEFFTKNEYQLRTRNAFTAVSTQQLEAEDLVHMNTDYGRATLDQLLSASVQSSKSTL